MARTVFRLRENSAGAIDVDMYEAATPNPHQFDEMAPHPLGFDPNHPDVGAFRGHPKGGGKTAAIGQALFQGLKQHPSLQLDLAINQKDPIYVCDPSLRSQALPWETLAQGGDFIALRDGQQLARMVLSTEPTPTVRPFERELRVLAVLAAAGTDPNHPEVDPLTSALELDALARALQPLPPAIGLRVLVLGCDAEVQAAVNALGDPRFSFEFLMSSENDQAFTGLLAAAEALQPHVLHFFCHGQAGDAPRLELATRVDQEMGRPNGSVVLESEDLAKFLQRAPGLWLAVLNCCLGATPTAESPGLARLMVKDGFPAAIGMQEPIDRPDAHRFSTSFYDGLRRALLAAVALPQPAPIDWPILMVEPRQKLCRGNGPLSQAGGAKVWTLPVLYVGPKPFVLQVTAAVTPAAAAQPAPQPAAAPGPVPPVPPAVPAPAPAPSAAAIAEAQAELATLTGLRAELAASATPPAILATIDDRLAQLHQTLAAR